MPLWIVAIPILAAVGFVTYVIADAVMGWIDPKIKRYLIRRFEEKTGEKWNSEWDDRW